MASSYAKRNKLLRRLGYSHYGEYLRSPLWANIRSRVLRAGGKCKLCSSPATQVHHRDYSEWTILGRSLRGLMPICSDCHARIEFGPDNKKRSLRQAQKALSKLEHAIYRRSHPPKLEPSRPKPPKGPGRKYLCKQCKAGQYLKIADLESFACPCCGTVGALHGIGKNSQRKGKKHNALKNGPCGSATAILGTSPHRDDRSTRLPPVRLRKQPRTQGNATGGKPVTHLENA